MTSWTGSPKPKTATKKSSQYEYDLANEQTKITYPNKKAVTREYDNAGRLKKVTDWSRTRHQIRLRRRLRPESDDLPHGDEQRRHLRLRRNRRDERSQDDQRRRNARLARLHPQQRRTGQRRHQQRAPRRRKTRLHLRHQQPPHQRHRHHIQIRRSEQPHHHRHTHLHLRQRPRARKSKRRRHPKATYAYDELGERTKTNPNTGPATTYGYDQAGNLTSRRTTQRRRSDAEIEDTYAYNGDGLRTSQTISGTTTYLAWDLAEKLPLILNDGTNSYIYGPGGLPIEQINNSTGTVLYLHHDQQGSTRLLTRSTGTKEASFTYDAYGNQTGHTGTATTPLGYDGQYTNADTGLIYLRAREYDPATAQFLTDDPDVAATLTPYSYAVDNPVNGGDPTGLETLSQFAHKWGREFARINRMAAKGHIDIGLFDDVALTSYYAKLFELSNEENTNYYNSWKSYYALTFNHVTKALAPLAAAAETTTSPLGLIKALAQVAANLFGI